MRLRLNVDGNLVAEAAALAGLADRSALIDEALKALIARRSARRLAQLGGSDGEAVAPRRRPT